MGQLFSTRCQYCWNQGVIRCLECNKYACTYVCPNTPVHKYTEFAISKYAASRAKLAFLRLTDPSCSICNPWPQCDTNLHQCVSYEPIFEIKNDVWDHSACLLCDNRTVHVNKQISYIRADVLNNSALRQYFSASFIDLTLKFPICFTCTTNNRTLCVYEWTDSNLCRVRCVSKWLWVFSQIYSDLWLPQDLKTVICQFLCQLHG